MIIGQYLKQLRQLRDRFDIPLITGQTPNSEREELYAKFRTGEIKRLILSKVGNFALDLPDANVLIQVSGTFGSRQEEAQRLGRILRPKPSGEIAYFTHWLRGIPVNRILRIIVKCSLPSRDIAIM